MRRHFFLGRPTAFRVTPRLALFARWPRPRRPRRAPRALSACPAVPGGPAQGVPVGLRARRRCGASAARPPDSWRKVAIALAGLFAAAVLAIFLLDVLLWPTLRTLAQAEIQNLAVTGMYEAVREEIGRGGADYRQLFRVETDEAGQVTFMQPDTVAVNDCAARIAVAIQKQVQALDGRKICIPLGRALGSRLFGGIGPRISVTVYPVMLEDVRIWDAFESAGINQTRHRIYLNVQLRMRTAIPFIQADVPVEADFPLAEAVVVGQVPSTYVGGVWLPFFPKDGQAGADTGNPTGGPAGP